MCGVRLEKEPIRLLTKLLPLPAAQTDYPRRFSPVNVLNLLKSVVSVGQQLALDAIEEQYAPLKTLSRLEEPAVGM
ncbi:MAG TPA: hypothetical protein V6C85_34060 [Allocoleopsis sp.]